MKRFIPVWGWGVLIFTLSSIPNFNPPGPKIFGIDKIGHFGEYLIFALLIFKNLPQKKFINFVPLILLFALIDELHQKFIPGREVEFTDLGVDFIGILCGWLWMEGKMRIFKKHDELSEVRDSISILNKRIRKVELDLRALRFRKTKWEDLKVGVFVDVQNMFYAAKKHSEARLDYVKLLSYIVKGRRLIKALAYMIENPEIDQSAFVSLLAHHSFEVRRKQLITRADGSQKGDWDMEMALDIMNLTDSLDVVVLVSGDGDFVSLVDAVKARGPRVEVHSFSENTAIDLKDTADEFFPIGDNLLFRGNEKTHS